MKAGILTLQEADNYGAVLQAYALQTALAHLDTESEFVVFKNEHIVGKKTVEEPDKAFVAFIKKEGEKRSAHFDKFRKKYLNYSVPVSIQNAEELNKRYDVFIAGSDQIWNFNIPEVDRRYFLPFADSKKRFSYAASFGGNGIPEREMEWCVEQLKKFQKLSVREDSGKKLIKDIIGRDSVVCLDPVFLLDYADWEKLTVKTEREPYVLLYLVQYSKELVSYVQNLAIEKGLGLHIVTAAFMYPCGFHAWSGIDVNMWLSLVKNAEYVFTNSFHGMAFSLIFGRPFSVLGLRDKMSERNGRIEEVLEKAGLEKCLNGKPAGISVQELEERFAEMKEISYNYLKKVVTA